MTIQEVFCSRMLVDWLIEWFLNKEIVFNTVLSPDELVSREVLYETLENNLHGEA